MPAVLAMGAAGCASSVSQRELETALTHRYGLTSEQASCVAKGLFDHFSADDLRRIRTAPQTASLPSALQIRLSKQLQALERSCGAATVQT
jgi:hypothetical protein